MLIVVGDELLAQALDWVDEDETLAVVGLVPRLSPWAEAAGSAGRSAASRRRTPPRCAGGRSSPTMRDARDIARGHLPPPTPAWRRGRWRGHRGRAARCAHPVRRRRRRRRSAPRALTPREQEVLELLSIGLSNRGIADRLGISGHTVKFHVAAIYGKLGVSGRTAAVNRALRRGILKILIGGTHAGIAGPRETQGS